MHKKASSDCRSDEAFDICGIYFYICRAAYLILTSFVFFKATKIGITIMAIISEDTIPVIMRVKSTPNTM